MRCIGGLTPCGTSSTEHRSLRQARASLPAMDYAVIRTGGKQYRVTPGSVLRVERLDGDVGATVEFAEVLLAGSDDGEAAGRIGRPPVEGGRGGGQSLAPGRGPKILPYNK